MASQLRVKVKYCSYPKEQLETALKLIRTGVMSCRGAAKMCKVPKTILLDKLLGRVPDQARSGPSPVLTKAEDGTLVQYIELLSSVGYPMSKRAFLCEVKKVLDGNGRSTPFKDNLPG